MGWWWLRGLDSYRRRPRLIILLWHGFLIFIIFNATVVFKDGIQRWVGLLICLLGNELAGYISLKKQKFAGWEGRVDWVDTIGFSLMVFQL